jgi:hypothetical protein
MQLIVVKKNAAAAVSKCFLKYLRDEHPNLISVANKTYYGSTRVQNEIFEKNLKA